MKYLEAHMRIQYEGETDSQYEARCEAMRAHNAEVDRIAAEFDAPMKGLRPEWDCGCWFNCVIETGRRHRHCPRIPPAEPLKE